MKHRTARLFIAVATVLAGLNVEHRAYALVGENALQSDVSVSSGLMRAESSQGPPADRDASVAAPPQSAPINGVTKAVSSPLTSPAQTPTDLKLRSGLQLQIGQQRVDQSGALFSNSHDNARMVGLSDAAERYQVQMFGYKIQPAIQDDGANLYFTPAKVSSGASLQIDNLDHWNVQSAYFTSNTGELKSPVGSSSDIGAWNISADRHWLRKTLETRIEYARTQATFDADNAWADDAVDIRMDVLSMPWLQLPLFTQWTAGVHHRSVGDQYYSASGIYLPNGLDETSTFLQSSTDRFDVRVGWHSSEQARIDTLGLLARSQQRTMLSLTYRPMFDEGNFVQDLLGTPSLTTNVHSANQIEPDYGFGRGMGNSAQPLISNIDQQGVTLRFEQPWLQWSLQYQQVYQSRFFEQPSTNRAGDGVPNLESDATLLSVNLSPADDVSIRMTAQWNQLSEEENPNLSQQDFYNLGATFELVPSMHMVLNYHYAQNQSSTFNMNADTADQLSSAELSWRALPLNGSQPAVELSLKSSYGMFGDYVSNNFDQRWATQLSVNIYWGLQRL